MTGPLHFILPGDPDTPTGGYAYDRRIIGALRAAGREVAVHVLTGTYPNPDPDALAAAEAVLAAIPDGARVVVDGLALGVLPEAAARHGGRVQLIALVHHPLAEETGLSEGRRQALAASEREALSHARRVIVTSPFTMGVLGGYGVTADRIGVVPPGTDPAPRARGSGGPGLHLIAVGSLIRRKGYDVLVTALSHLTDRPWRLTVAGSDAMEPHTAADLGTRIAAADLAGRVTLAGVLTDAELAALYDGGDVFVLASRYEGFGMVLTEALARGLPIVATTAGAVPHTVPADAGLLAGAGDAAALAKALARIMDDEALRESLAAGARRAGETLPDWDTAAATFAAEADQA